MSDPTAPRSSTAIPALRYRDGAAAIDWLCRAFGFERRLVVPGEDGSIRHSQLVLGRGMVMVGSRREGTADDGPRSGGAESSRSVYVVVEDVDAHYRRAIDAGAAVVVEIEDQGPRGRFYACRDPEGYLWNFGDYDPWQGP